MTASEQARADIVEEAIALVQAAEQQRLTLRLFGGVAIRVRASAEHPALAREYKDIDLFAPRGTSRRVAKLFEERAYAQDAQFNAVHGHYRLIYDDEAHGRQVDIFVGKFEMCHALPLAERLAVHPLTLPPADLLLTKLQIVQLTDKDQRDVLALLLDHAVGEQDDDAINAGHIARLCAGDWGLWRTVTGNLERLGSAAGAYALSAEERELITQRSGALTDAIAARRKSPRWKTRAIVGDRMQWYELPEEVDDE
jgi:hypothetical protein